MVGACGENVNGFMFGFERKKWERKKLIKINE
jgi:hypothetical protein